MWGYDESNRFWRLVMKHIMISKENWVWINNIRSDYSLRNNNEVITLIIEALGQYETKYGSIELDTLKERTTVQQENQ
jgi:hypothetical protein